MPKIDEDSWMNPSRSVSYQSAPAKDGTYYVIERKKRIIVTGPSGSLERWDTWHEYRDKAERDTELKRLRETTSWVLRGRVYRYLKGRPIGGDPAEHMDF